MPQSIYKISITYKSALRGGRSLPINFTTSQIIEGDEDAAAVVVHLRGLGFDPEVEAFHGLTKQKAIVGFAASLAEFPVFEKEAAND